MVCRVYTYAIYRVYRTYERVFFLLGEKHTPGVYELFIYLVAGPKMTQNRAGEKKHLHFSRPGGRPAGRPVGAGFSRK